ncbi:MAG: type VI secretion system protein TssA [Pirellulales bacterium]|nr:type VI secretion system protein TssA [Pirellulales bacterium]
MASAVFLDFDRLLAPFSGDNPAGAALRENFSPNSSYSAVKTAREAARAAERQMVWEGDEPVGPPANWNPVLELGPQIIAEESKDLEVAAWLTEALIRERGFAGLRDGFRLMRELAENFWDCLYPLPDEDGVPTRVAPLAGLNGVETDGVLIKPIVNVPITEPGTHRAFTLADYKRACDLSQVSDPGKRSQRIDQGTASLEMFERALAETPPEFYRTLVDDMEECRAEFEKLTAVMAEKCGVGNDGFSLAPPSSSIRNALESAHEQVLHLARAHLASLEGEQSATLAAAGGNSLTLSNQSSAAMASRVQTREDAFRLLLQVADFFKRTEPHSPVAYALEQAVRWGKMPLPDLWAELVPDDVSRSQLFKLVGIQPPEDRG